MMRNKTNKKETHIELRMMSKYLKTRWTKNKLRKSLGWCPNDEKPKEQTSNLNQTYDGVPMFRNQMKKEKTEIKPWMV